MSRINTNQLFLAGNLTRDPDTRQLNGGNVVCKFSVANNERYKDRNGDPQEQTHYVDVEVWGRSADACGKHLSRGSSVFVEGKLQMDAWEDKETGRKRSKLYVRANRVHFLDAPPERPDSGRRSEPAGRDEGAKIDQDDIPF
jgi:single-strand DNA-binding protein